MSNRLAGTCRLGLVISTLALCGFGLGGRALSGDGRVALGISSALPEGPPTWQVTGDSIARFGASLASAGDVNGDGIDDVIIAAPDYDTPSSNTHEGRVYLYLGSPQGPATTPVWTADGTRTGFGEVVAPAGDVNGDGFDDIIVTEPNATYGLPGAADHWTGQAYVYLGSASGPEATPSWVGHSGPFALFGAAAASAGDVNGDGYDDVIIGAPSSYGYGSFGGDIPHVFLYLGSPAGLSAEPGWAQSGHVPTDPSAPFGSTVAGAGDVNHDGYDDVLVGEPGHTESGCAAGKVYLYSGGPSGLSPEPVWTRVGQSNCYSGQVAFGCFLTSGRFDEDPYSDFIAGCSGQGPMMFRGSQSGPLDDAWRGDGTTMRNAGDVNGDHLDDVIAGGLRILGPSPREGVSIYLGGALGLTTSPVWTVVADQASAFGTTVAGAGDTDGDGLANVLVGAPRHVVYQQVGAAFLFFGPVVVPCFADVDGDGYCPTGPAADCNDTDPGIHPFADEICNGLDDDCNGRIDDDVLPDSAEVCNGIDDDCDGQVDEGFHVGQGCSSGLGTCNVPGHIVCAANGATRCEAPPPGPPGPELCDGLDNDCDGMIDDDLPDPDACHIASTTRAGALLGTSVAHVGDVNGDGFEDVLVGAPGDGDGRVNIHYGSATGGFRTPDWTYAGTQTPSGLPDRSAFGSVVAPLGDLDQDGFDDFIVGAPGYGPYQFESTFGTIGAAFVFLGDPLGPHLGMQLGPNQQLPVEFGSAVAGGGDLDGDGIGDFAVSAPRGEYGVVPPQVSIFTHGGTSRITRSGPHGSTFGSAIAIAPDINGDGFDDLLVNLSSPQQQEVHLFFGQPGGVGAAPSQILPIGFGGAVSVAGAGDVNRDGYGDVLVGWSGRAALYIGSPAGLVTTPIWTSDGGQSGSGFGRSVSRAGDVNEDGFADLIIGAPFYVAGGQAQGAAFLFLGGPAGPSASPAWVGSLANMAGVEFGSAVSGGGDYDGDGIDDLLFGAPRFNSGGAPQSGRVDLVLSRTVCSGADGDGDGVPDCADNCPGLAGSGFPDQDVDGRGDVCDSCPAQGNHDQADGDGDGRGDVCDNCPTAANPGQQDANQDGAGDACQPAVSITEFRNNGPDVIEALVSARDPQGETLSGNVTIVPDTLKLLDVSETMDCGLGYLPDGEPGRGIAFLNTSYGEPFLMDLDSNLICDDGSADFQMAYGRCSSPDGPFETFLSLGGLGLPHPICVRPVPHGDNPPRVDWTIVSIGPGFVEIRIEGRPPLLDVPFTGLLPGTLDISGLEPGSFVLSIKATDGNTPPVTASGIFQHAAEATMALVTGSGPAAVITAPASVECDRPGGGAVTLDGSGSTDPNSTPGTNDDIASFGWYEDFGTAGERLLGSGETLSLDLPLGAHAITLLITDHAGHRATASSTVTVIDTGPPTLTLQTNPAMLWPPNHGLVPVNVAWSTGDACDPEGVVVVLVDVGSSEPDDAASGTDGATMSDVQDAVVGGSDAALLLRAERDGGGPGRVYTLTYRASDGSGNTTTALATVIVPHDLGQGPEPLLMRIEPVAPGSTSVRAYWPTVSGASAYDVITGDLQAWHVDDGALNVGPVRVLARATTATSLAEPAGAANPPVGRAVFYLIQHRTGGRATGYGTESAPLPRVAVICEGGCPGAPTPPAASGQDARVRK